jgi:DNA-binding response OmpR family regulator
MKDKVILAVDDEPKILELVKSYLELNGYTALCASSAREGLALFQTRDVSLILLDLMLPDFPGEVFCRRVREVSNIPIIMMTAKVEEEDIINGLKTGADDYVCKPFSPRQLVARVDAVLRRIDGGDANAKLSFEDLSVDTQNRVAALGKKQLSLTRDEYQILALLMSRAAKIFTRDEILDAIGGEGFDRSVDTHIKNLRAKLSDDPKSPKYISTVYGMGYRMGAR